MKYLSNIMVLILTETKDYYKLYSILEKALSNVEIDIKIVKTFLEPMDILMLTQFIIVQKQRNCNIIISADKNILEYLKAICIVDFCKYNYNVPITIDAIESCFAMPIRRVEEQTMDYYINQTQLYFKSFCEGKDLGMLNLCLSELINNVYNHSHSQIGAYVFAEYNPRLKEIKLAVSDLGIGIPMSVNNYNKENGIEEFTAIKCVEWALKENMTTKSIPQNKGKGLDNIQSFMKANDCNWTLYSDIVLMNGNPLGIEFKTNPISFFRGTLVQLNIKIDNLQNEEIQEEFNWF
jgi:hypothetical protein